MDFDIQTIFSNPIILGAIIFISAIFIIVILLKIVRLWLKRGHYLPAGFHNDTLLVMVPKEFAREDDERRTIPELILQLEPLYTNLGGLKPQRGLNAFLFGRHDNIAFEIIKDKEERISFYVTVPHYLKNFTEQQIHSAYPSATVEKVEDYNIFMAQGETVGAYLVLKKPYIFPINTYKKLEVDPLNAITNSLSKLNEGEGAAIQILARSANAAWHAWPAKVASEMQQGKKLKEAMNSSAGSSKGFVGSIFKSIFTSSKAKEDDLLDKPKPHQLSPMDEEIIKSLGEKTSKAGFDVNIRIAVSCKEKENAERQLRNIVNSFSQFSGYEYGNGFSTILVGGKRRIFHDLFFRNFNERRSVLLTKNRFFQDFIFRNFSDRNSYVLNTEEMNSIYHFPIKLSETPNIRWLMAKKAAPPSNLPDEGIILGETDYRGQKSLIRIKDQDRQRHVYIIGQTGSGKSYTMANMAVQDIQRGEGCCLIDPHGGLIDEYVLPNIPKERAEDVIYFDPSDMERPMGLNLLEYDKKYPEQKTFVINEMINIFDKLYNLSQTGGPMFEQYMRNAMLLVMDDPNDTATLLEIPKVMADKQYRTEKLAKATNIVVKRFWEEEAEKAGGEASLANMVPYITSKLSTFISNDYMRPIIAQKESGFNFRKVMDERKILLINLSKGRIGDLNAKLLGLVMVGKILMASLSRVDIPEEERKPFYLYIDEFQNYVTDSIAVILSEARKYKLCLTMAHQYLGQLVENNDTTIKDAVFGNVGTIAAYRVGVEDAELFAKQFEPVFNEYDVMNVDKYGFNLKLLIDNTHARPFNVKGRTLPKGNPQMVQAIKELSRLKYGKDRNIIESEIALRTAIKKPLPLNPAFSRRASISAFPVKPLATDPVSGNKQPEATVQTAPLQNPIQNTVVSNPVSKPPSSVPSPDINTNIKP
ncbi:MAG: type IV secretory system conjugative DNA transfer family protein [Patescibacteria group bacterium]